MVKRVHKGSDGHYHVAGGKFKVLVGSRAQVMHGTAYKTKGGLKKSSLKFNKHGKIVSRAKSAKEEAFPRPASSRISEALHKL